MKKLIITIAALVPTLQRGNAIFHLIIAITLLAAASANAQLYKGFGFKAGTSIATQQYTYKVDNSKSPFLYKVGFTFGIFKELHVLNILYANFGINYSQKGRLEKYFSTNELGQVIDLNAYKHFNFNFITTEIYAKYILQINKVKPYGLAGLRLDFYLSRNEFLRYQDVETEIKPRIAVANNKIFGGSIGIGVEYEINKNINLILEGTYNPDFTNIFDNNIEAISGRSFDIRTGIKF